MAEPGDEQDEAALAALRPAPWRRLWDHGSTYLLTRSAVLRLLGLVYFVAFVSALRQAPALIGEHGLVPMQRHLALAVARESGSRALAMLRAPTLFLLDSSDAALTIACGAGAALALAVMAGVTNAIVMLALWALQLSLLHAGQIFWGYGWELLLVECGALAALLCPLRGLRPFRSPPPPLVAIWLLRFLLFRVMLGAGLIKWRGDPCWRDLTCLVFHYETQPIPSPGAWLFHQLPAWAHAAGVLFNHVVELVVPPLVFGPRAVRRVAGGLVVLFQLLLVASGNLSFLNWLTIVPALACFDDALLVRLAPRRARERLLALGAREPARAHVWTARAFAAVVALLSVRPMANLFAERQLMNASFDPLRLVNTYGAFGTVTRERLEIVFEGTRDEVPDASARWEAYELPCKPGDPARRPCLVTPYHYRLDWQMWFAAMSTYDQEPWIAALVDKLLAGDRTIAPLLAHDPFPDAPPRWIRAELFRYELTRWGEAGWWRRRRVGEYMRPLSREDPDLRESLRDAGLPRAP